MAPSAENLAPAAAAPVTGVDIPKDFHFGSTVLQPHTQPSQQKKNQATTALDVLEKFHGTYRGFGFNTIFRPSSRTTPPQFDRPPSDAPDNPDDNVLQLNLTAETQVFGNELGNIPNRGLFNQADIDLLGLPYTQTIADAMPPPKDGTTPPPKTPPVIHFETGLWMRVPQVKQMPKLAASFCRMGSIPHGTTINAQGFSPSQTASHAPSIPKIDISPFLIIGPKSGETNRIKFQSQTATSTASRRLPQDLGPFIANGTITPAILENPNSILTDANKGKDIIDNTFFFVSSIAPRGTFGGGTSNIGFNIGADAGLVNLQPDPNKPVDPDAKGANANASNVIAQYWVSRVRAKIELGPSMKPDQIVSPARLGPRDAVPEFILDIAVPTSKQVVTVVYTQIQYSQAVSLDFNSLRWPHVTVATLAPTVDASAAPADRAKRLLSAALVKEENGTSR